MSEENGWHSTRERERRILMSHLSVADYWVGQAFDLAPSCWPAARQAITAARQAIERARQKSKQAEFPEDELPR